MNESGSLAEVYLEQSPACHWIAGSDGRFLRVYGDASAFFGRPAAELAGSSLTDLPPEQAALWQSRFKRVLSGEQLTLNERCRKASWYVTVFPVHEEGSVRYIAGLARNVSPWGTAEDDLRQT